MSDKISYKLFSLFWRIYYRNSLSLSMKNKKGKEPGLRFEVLVELTYNLKLLFFKKNKIKKSRSYFEVLKSVLQMLEESMTSILRTSNSHLQIEIGTCEKDQLQLGMPQN